MHDRDLRSRADGLHHVTEHGVTPTPQQPHPNQHDQVKRCTSKD